MSQVVVGVGASHTTLMNTQWDKVDHLPRAHSFRDALGEAHDAIAAAAPDLLVVIGSNHFRGLWLDMMPAFTVGVGEVMAVGEHGTPSGTQETDPETALALCAYLINDGFDLAMSTRLQIDHGISHAIQYLVTPSTPVVPIIVNVFAPPLPTLKRCRQLGEALRIAIQNLPGEKRVAVIGTGGLSHRLPFPDWRVPRSDDDKFLVDSWREGRGNWEEYEPRRRALVVGARAELNVDFDTALLARLEAGLMADLPDELDNDELVRLAGNGANEIRSWLIMAAACGYTPGRVLAYSPMPEWLTGMAVAVLNNSPDHG